MFGKGGYIILRRSKYHPLILHAMWAKDLENIELHEFVPESPKKGWRAIFHNPLFKGKIQVKKGDE